MEVVVYNPDSGLGRGKEVAEDFWQAKFAFKNNKWQKRICSQEGSVVLYIIGGDGTYATVLGDIAKLVDERSVNETIKVVLVPAGQENVMSRCLEDRSSALNFREIAGERFFWSLEVGRGAEPLGLSVLGFVERFKKIPFLKKFNRELGALVGGLKFIYDVVRGRIQDFDVEIAEEKINVLSLIVLNQPFLGWGRIDLSSSDIPEQQDLVGIWHNRFGLLGSALLGVLQMMISQMRRRSVDFGNLSVLEWRDIDSTQKIVMSEKGNYIWVRDSEFAGAGDSVEISERGEVSGITIKTSEI